MNKKLIFLTARLPYPPVSGRKNVMYYYCKYLYDMYGYEIVNISFLEENDNVKDKPEFISKTYEIKSPSAATKLRNLLIDTVLRRKYPMQVSLYYDEKIKKTIHEIVENEKPDLIMCDMIRTSEYFKDININKILDMDDMLSVRYERQLNSDITNINPYGAFLYTLPKRLQGILLSSWIKKVVLKTETYLIKKYETNISASYNSVVFVAQREAEELNKRLNARKAFSVPLGVDFDYFSGYKASDKIENSISFLGAMSVAHNETAVIYFCEKILPLVKREIPDVKFYIIGGGVTDKIRKLESENVIITGRVDDVREHVSRTQVFVCPLLFGSGIKTKNLEAMAMGIPVVTTSIGAESIDAVDNQDCLIRDGEEEFKSAIVEVLRSKEIQEKLAANGYNYIKDNFTWDMVMHKWQDVLDFSNKINK